MPIVQFENRNETTLILTVEPWSDSHEIPHLATAGIRYSLKDRSADRAFVSVEDGTIEFWCEAENYEVEVIHPSQFQRLCWDICVNGGWCGGIIDNKPTTVLRLLPSVGEISACQFAELVMQADGWPPDEPLDQKHFQYLRAKFVEYFGAETVGVDQLRLFPSSPFQDEAL